MHISIVSDTHSRHATVATVVAILRERQVDCVIHCGDIEDGETVRLYQPPTNHFAFGNCDTDCAALRRAMADTGATLHEDFGFLELAGKKIAWTHGDDHVRFRGLENSDAYDYVFYGHS